MKNKLLTLILLVLILIVGAFYFKSTERTTGEYVSLNECFVGEIYLRFIPDTYVLGIITNYHPVEAQTDSTPLITASGKKVEEGMIANNCLPFGTIVEVEDLGIYEVQDRMNKKYGCNYFDVLTFDLDERFKLIKEVIIYD